jgi:hypothetical protein
MENNEDDFKLEKEDVDEEDGNIKIYDDSYHDEIGKKIDNMSISLEDREHNVNNQIMKYYNDLTAKRNEYKNIFKNLNDNYIEQTLLYEKIVNEINLLNVKISEYKDEIRQVHEDTTRMKTLNPTIKEIMKNPITEKIKNILLNVDLSKIPKFAKLLSETKNIYVLDATDVLRGKGGSYLKEQTAVIYYLYLLKKRYSVTTIIQEQKVYFDKLDNRHKKDDA